MPKLLPRHYAKILYEVTHGLPANEYDQALQNFLAMLKSQHALKKLPQIMKEFTEYADEKEGIHHLEVTSAHELTPTVLQKIVTAFSPKAKATTAVDPELIGGVVIRTRQAILDASLRSRVQQLGHKLAGRS